MSLLGALVYPTLLADISDIANPHWRAIGIGFIADVFDLSIAIQTVAWISLGPGIFVLLVMQETRKKMDFTIGR